MKVKLYHVNGNEYLADVLYSKAKKFVKLVSLTNKDGAVISKKTITFRRVCHFLAKKPRFRQNGSTNIKLDPLFTSTKKN